MKEKIKLNHTALYIAGIFLVLIGLVGFVTAQNDGITIPLKFLVSADYQPSEQTIGAYVSSPTTYTDMHVTNDLVVDKLATLTGALTMNQDVTVKDGSNSTRYFHQIIDFTDNTSTPVIWSSNDDSINDFYLMDLWVENTGKATSTVRTCVSTTTAGTVFGSDDATLLTDDAGQCTLMRTLSNAFGADGATWDGRTATSSTFGILEYPGSDTRIAAQKLGFLVNSTTDIFVRATGTTEYLRGLVGADTFDGKLHIIGRESNR